MENVQNRQVPRQESEFLLVSVWGGDGSGVEGVAADMGGASCCSEWGVRVPYVMKYKRPLEVRCAITL